MNLVRNVLKLAQELANSGCLKEAEELDKIAGKLEKGAGSLDLRQMLFLHETALNNLNEFLENQAQGGELGQIVPSELLGKVLTTAQALRDNIPAGDAWKAIKAW